MVNRYTLINVENLINSFNVKEVNLKSIYNAFPTKKLPIISLKESHKVSLENWGSTNDFSKNKKLPTRLVNVSFSKVEKSNIYINQFKSERCLIPCDGFYFWKNYNSKEKTPYYFKLHKEKLIYCVGIRDSFEDFNGLKFTYFYFLTNPSLGMWKDYTSKIPIVFDMRYFDIWLNKKSTLKKLTPFMTGLKFDDLRNHSVSPYFEDKNNDDSSLIKPMKKLNQYGNYSLFD